MTCVESNSDFHCCVWQPYLIFVAVRGRADFAFLAVLFLIGVGGILTADSDFFFH